MEEPYLGHTHEFVDGSEIAHRLVDPHLGVIVVWARPSDSAGPQVKATLTLDEARRLAISLLRDVNLALDGHG
jgi:hypothetical protein